MPKGWDFFMAAHTALQGTVSALLRSQDSTDITKTKPAHYVVLLNEITLGARNEIKLGANELEKITYNLCYLKGRRARLQRTLHA